MTFILLFQSVVLLLVFALLWAGHFTPWRRLPGMCGDDGKLKPVIAYVYGTTCILLGFGLWALMHLVQGVQSASVIEAIEFLGLCTVSAGLGTTLPRLLDVTHENAVLKADRGDLEQTLHERS